MQLLDEQDNTSSSLPQGSENISNLKSLELFAGAGGLALGTHAAGFRHLGLIERDDFAVQTLRENSQRVLNLNPDFIFQADVRSFDYTSFSSNVDLLSGGPPCQPFSNSGSSLGPDDPRDMFPTFLDAVAVIMPKAILIENVKGLLREKFREYFDYILKRLRYPLHSRRNEEGWRDHYRRLQSVRETDFADSEQYIVTFQLVNTADYGISQRRERVLISAFRRDLGIDVFQIKATHSKEALLVEQWITGDYWKRHGVEPCDYLTPKNKKLVEDLKSRLLLSNDQLPWRTVRDVLYDLPRPVARGEQEEIPNHIQHPGAREYEGHWASVYDYPSKVLKAGTHGTPGGENMVRVPSENAVRYYTTREAARLQTFPDSWRFHGTWGSCIRQLGNAVPVELIRIFAKEINQRLVGIFK